MPDFDIKKFNELNRFQRVPGWWHDVFRPWYECAQRILVVTDNFLNYLETDDFGLTEFLLALETATPSGMAPIIHIAHRSDDPDRASAAMKAKFTYHQNFKFENANTPSALMNGTKRQFDQVWIFAAARSNTMSATEKQVVTDFMNARGGVFATGDHEDLGFGMCGDLLRIKNMRNWSGVPAGGLTRIDTTNEPSPNGTWNFDSQSDPLPQRIFPHFEEVAGGTFAAHPILKYGSGTSFQSNVIDVLPDHAHESECWLGTNPGLGGSVDPAEFPPLPGQAAAFAPAAVATSMSGGRIIDKGPVTPRSFIAINAYDGHRVNVGRIVCDATWHHFVNVNLDGTPTSWKGLREESPAGSGIFVPNAAYQKIKQYFRNIAHWVGPVRWCRWYLELVAVRYKFPLMEEWREIPKKPDWPELVQIGKLVQSAIDQQSGEATAANMLKDIVTVVPDAQSLLLPNSSNRESNSLIPPDALMLGLLGSVAHAVYAELPDLPDDLGKKFAKQKSLHESAEGVVISGLQQGLQHAQEHYLDMANQTISLLKERDFKMQLPN